MQKLKKNNWMHSHVQTFVYEYIYMCVYKGVIKIQELYTCRKTDCVKQYTEI